MSIALDCGHTTVPGPAGPTGYGTTHDGRRLCYTCIADADRAEMIQSGTGERLPLYLSKRPDGTWYVGNWPGTLHFPVRHMLEGRHNFARTRTDVWFVGPDGHDWHGVQYGDNAQIVHCKRTRWVWVSREDGTTYIKRGGKE
jgi:hypothetical protein